MTDTHGESGESMAPRIIEALGVQASLQFELFRAEIDRDVWDLVVKLMPFAVGIPLLGLGYTFGSVAAALAIATLVMPTGGLSGPTLGATIVGVVNLALGGGISWFASRRMKPRHPTSENSRRDDE